MNFIVTLVLTFFLSLVLTKITIANAGKFGLVDDPKKHKHPAVIHKRVTPRAGGLPIFLAFVIASLATISVSQKLAGLVLGGSILVGLGLVDDRYDLKSSYKLAGQILAAVVVVASGIGISFITNPIFALGIDPGASEVIRFDTLRIIFDFLGSHSIVVFADLFAIFWIVWVVNMVNFSAGVDGQMPGIVIIALFVIFAASFRFYNLDESQLVVSKLSMIGIGAAAGFLFFNFNPAKIFPGDSGSYFLGFLVAVLAILSGAKVGAAILVMAIPLVDGAFTVVRRMAGGKSPFLGDKKHLHHRLLEVGMTQRQVALFYWLLCAILGAVALILPSSQKLFAGVIVAIIILGGLVWLNLNLPQKAQK